MRNSTRSCGHVICWHLKGCETMTELCKGSGYLVGITLLEEFIGKVLSMKSRAYFQDVSFFQSVSWFFPTFKQMFSHQRQMSAARSLWMPQRSQRKTRCSETSLGIWVLYLQCLHAWEPCACQSQLITWCIFWSHQFPVVQRIMLEATTVDGGSR